MPLDITARLRHGWRALRPAPLTIDAHERWRIVLGFILFRDVPNLVTMMGAGIVIASTLYITFREVKMGARKAPASDE